jgi:hypothetical protein
VNLQALDPVEGHASAQRTVHRLTDLGITRVWVPVEQRLRRHDLTILAIATLRGLLLDPRPLQGKQFPVFREPLERRHLARTAETGVMQERMAAPPMITVHTLH